MVKTRDKISITQEGAHYHVRFGDTDLPALWLRERAQGEQALDKMTNQRHFNPHLLDCDLFIGSAELTDEGVDIAFSDGYREVYGWEFFDNCAVPRTLLPAPVTWKNPLPKSLKHDWRDLSDNKKFLAALKDYLQYGFIVITDCPLESPVEKTKPVLTVGRKFGYIQEIFDGDCWNIISKPDYNDLAYKAGALAPHSDMPYSLPQPGAQLLLCAVNETSGGLSLLVDSLQVAETLKAADPDYYDALSRIAVRFQYDSLSDSVALDRPIIETDYNGTMTGVRYSPRLDFMPLLPDEALRRYQKARQAFNRILDSDDHQITFRLQQGECMMFDNSRILHGRTSYDANEGLRHLQGTYIRRDGPASLYRKLCRDGTLDKTDKPTAFY